MMTRSRAIAETFHIAALSMCLGVIGMSGFVAAILFPTMKRLDPRLPAFESYTGDHWRIAAGQVGATMFGVVGWVQVGLMIVSLFSFAWAAKGSLGTSAGRSRSALVLLAMLTAIVCNASVYQPMVRIIGEFWAAAAGGQAELASAKQAAFSAMHVWSRSSMVGMAVLNLACLGAAARSLWSTPAPGPACGGESRMPGPR